MASDLKSDLVSKSYDMGPHVKLMGNPAVLTRMKDILTSTLKISTLYFSELEYVCILVFEIQITLT